MKNQIIEQNKQTSERNITLEEIKEGAGILEKIAEIFISIFSIFKSKQK